MNNTVTKIQLLGDVQGYLDVAENIIVPINFGIGDVRDLSKRTGTFSKTIVLPGTKNNNQLLNSYYDINIAAGTFSINKLQKCIILQNNIPIVEDAYLQLVAVNKIQNNLNEDDSVEYQVVIKDNVGDFFTKLGNRTLDGKDEAGTPYLDFSEFNHTFTAANITDSFDNTNTDGYKYLIPWVDDTELQINECKPAIYAKQYWDKIHASTGFTYTWSTLSAPNVQFDRLVIPYNGDDKKLSEEVVATIATKVQRGILGSMSSNGTSYNSSTGLIGTRVFTDYNTIVENGRMEIPPIQDPLNQWVQPNQFVGDGYFLNATNYLQPNTGISIKVTGKYSFIILNNGVNDVNLRSPLDPIRNGQNSYPFISATVTTPGGQTTLYRIPIDTTSNVLFPNITYTANTAQQIVVDRPFTATIFIPNMQAGSEIVFGQGIEFPFAGPIDGVVFATFNQVLQTPNMQIKLVVDDFVAEFTPVVNGIQYNFPLELNAFIPKQVKQSDFIKSICLMYNLFVEPDPNDETNLIYRHRDDFYDEGAAKDWTLKMDRGREHTVNFLPELSNKRLLLTYKQSDDTYNKLYFGSTTEIYGQQEIIFENDYVRGEDKKELIFSPTPMQPTPFQAICPLIPGISPKNNIRILIDGGEKVCGSYTLVNELNNSIQVNTYPLLSHFDKEYNPTFDINFGICDFYFYDIVFFTSNNLFNNFWRRTVSQIDQGKLLTAYFMLDESDISTLKLNDKIRIDNSWWNINRIIDYNANAKQATKVELMSIDDSLKLPLLIKKGPIRFPGKRDQYLPPNKEQVGLEPVTPITILPTIQVANTETSLTRNEQLSNYNSNGAAIVFGKNNEIATGFKGIVIGDNKSVPSTPGIYVGDYALTNNGLVKVQNIIGIATIIDGGQDIILPYDKTNEADVIDASENAVRKFGGGVAGGFIIDSRDTLPPLKLT